MYQTHLRVLVYVLISFVYALTGKQSALPTFNAEINKNDTALKFTCRVFKIPIDNKLHFLVNKKSVNVMHFSNSKCYNKSRECSPETCYCSFKDFSFTWFYPVNASSIQNTFGVVINVATGNHGEVIKIQISVIYDTSSFINNGYTYEVVVPASEKKDKEKPNRNGDYENLQLTIIITITLMGCLCVAMISIILIVKRRTKTRYSSKAQVKKVIYDPISRHIAEDKKSYSKKAVDAHNRSHKFEINKTQVKIGSYDPISKDTEAYSRKEVDAHNPSDKYETNKPQVKIGIYDPISKDTDAYSTML
ncbi:uncharacterized protein LOC143058958 [Mytilus galloprovincialis]|uniref:uncharacterized protein LOC143058958 n=1 Tax=Mytilus galloprovincialis TaxID=29158 RepID=UPI003F7B84DF